MKFSEFLGRNSLRHGLRLLMVLLGLFPRCTNQSMTLCADPLGTQPITINTSSVDYNNCFFCFKTGSVSGTDTCRFNFCLQLRDSSSAPQVIRSIYFTHCLSSSAGKISDVGPVMCLGAVTVKPSSGYGYVVNPTRGHGYVVLFSDGSYGRFFIDSWVELGGKITTMYITRQYPF